MKILISTSYAGTLPFPTGRFAEHDIVTQPRASDWGLSGKSKYLHLFAQTLRLLKQARRYDALVLCTVGMEAFIAGRWKQLIRRSPRLVSFDLLLPNESRQTRMLRLWLQGVESFACIRRGDIETLQRIYAISPQRCHFVPFPVHLPATQQSYSDKGYLYSAGWAHRDWQTLCQSLATLPYPAVLMAGVPLPIRGEAASRIKALPMQSPEVGRQLMTEARLVVLSLEDTYLPSGPLVLLDAMATGKAVVATNVNGTRDYVVDGKTGLLVPPGDAQALAGAIRRVMEDTEFRASLGWEAQRDVENRFTLKNTLTGIIKACQQAA